jgi:hypothetical protein
MLLLGREGQRTHVPFQEAHAPPKKPGIGASGTAQPYSYLQLCTRGVCKAENFLQLSKRKINIISRSWGEEHIRSSNNNGKKELRGENLVSSDESIEGGICRSPTDSAQIAFPNLLCSWLSKTSRDNLSARPSAGVGPSAAGRRARRVGGPASSRGPRAQVLALRAPACPTGRPAAASVVKSGAPSGIAATTPLVARVQVGSGIPTSH